MGTPCQADLSRKEKKEKTCGMGRTEKLKDTKRKEVRVRQVPSFEVVVEKRWQVFSSMALA